MRFSMKYVVSAKSAFSTGNCWDLPKTAQVLHLENPVQTSGQLRSELHLG